MTTETMTAVPEAAGFGRGGRMSRQVSAHSLPDGSVGRAPLRGVDVTRWAAIQAPGDRTS
jgi:hypothetical protein